MRFGTGKKKIPVLSALKIVTLQPSASVFHQSKTALWSRGDSFAAAAAVTAAASTTSFCCLDEAPACGTAARFLEDPDKCCWLESPASVCTTRLQIPTSPGSSPRKPLKPHTTTSIPPGRQEDSLYTHAHTPSAGKNHLITLWLLLFWERECSAM